MSIPTQPLSVHIPIGIAALALCVFLTTQIMTTKQNEKTLDWQAGNLATQLTNLDEADKSIAEAIKQRDVLVKQSDEIKAQYTTLLTDLLELAKTDADAKLVVDKYSIQNQAAAGQATPPASE